MVHEEAEERVQQGEVVRVRFHIIRYARIENVGKSQSCMFSKLWIIWKQTVHIKLCGARCGAQSSGTRGQTFWHEVAVARTSAGECSAIAMRGDECYE